MMKNPQEQQTKQKIQEILDKCSTGNYIFRGESKEYKQPASSGLHRQYCQSENNSANGSPSPINNENFFVFTVEKNIVEKVKRHIRPDALNIEVLTELQHYGGKTALLDFSKDIHIALFFACDGNFDTNGRIIFFETSTLNEETDIDYGNLDKNKEENIYTVISPTGKKPRVIFQSSIFVHTSHGYLEDKRLETIEIENNIKEPLLEYLSKHFNIKTETIYNDIQGFIRNQHNHPTAEIEFYRGHANHQEGKLAEAIEHYSKAIDLNPQLAEAYYNRGNVKYVLKQYKKAIKDYDKAIELNPQDAKAYNNRGSAKSTLGEYKVAIQDYNKAIELNPQFAEAYNNRGRTKSALKQYKEAIKDYDKAIELSPQFSVAYYNRGTAKFDLGRYEEAIKNYDKAIELNPQYANAYNNRGIAKSALKQYKESIKDYDIAKNLYEKKGNMEMAKKCENAIARLRKLMNGEASV